ncbi:hypothetical protein BDR22DRAFT_615181 [Usnea florida]
MSFGFSVSDIYGCARLAYVLYNEFKQAPGACQDFAKELLLFHQVLLKTKSTVQAGKIHLSHADENETALEICLDSCRELLYVRIMGAATAPRHLDKIKAWGCDPEAKFILHSTSDEKRFLSGLRQKLGERKFASRIPELQRAVSAHVEKLTAYNVLIVQSSQYGIQASQKRIEESIGESRDLLTKSTDNHMLQFESLSDRLETSQSRIEAQLQAILTNQQRTRTPILSQSLDASSPEGRQTWMELGRLLRDEGITPAMIRENRELLVNAMKSTLKAESVLESYVTAPEHKLNSYPLSGVDDVELEEVELENLELEGDSGEDDSLDNEPRQKRAVRQVVKPFVPTSERGESSSSGALAGVPSGGTSVPIEWGKRYSYDNNITQRPAPGVLYTRTASDNVMSPTPGQYRYKAKPLFRDFKFRRAKKIYTFSNRKIDTLPAFN